jgi:hypothetical protein
MLSTEAGYFWEICRMFRETVTSGDTRSARMAVAELAGLATYSGWPPIRSRALKMLRSIAGGSWPAAVLIAATDALQETAISKK